MAYTPDPDDDDDLIHKGQKRRRAGGNVEGVMPGKRLDKRASGGKLTAAERHALPAKDFALPGERYPIEDASHARNALARVSQHGSPSEKATVRSAVHRKYPGIGKE